MVEKSAHNTIADMMSIVSWANGNPNYMFIAGVYGRSALVTDESTSVAAVLSALGYDGTVLCWSQEANYQSASVAGFLSAINFSQPNSIATINLKSLPGFTPDNLNSTERRELGRKRVNYLDSVIGLDAYRQGWTTDERLFADSQAWLIWMEAQIQLNVFSLLRSAPAIPQTAAGVETLKATIERALEGGVRNGGIAPGTVSPAMRQDIRTTTGDDSFDGELSKGYKVFIGNLSDQTQIDRAARKAPPIKVWVKSSGAIHSVDITLIYEN